MSLVALSQAIESSSYPVISTDLFDTVLLRDGSTETQRLAEAGRRGGRLLGMDPEATARLRWSCHDSAYRAVALQRPGGDAALHHICRTMATALGLDEQAAVILRRAEVEVDIGHLRPNRPLLGLLAQAGRSGARVVAVSDTYYSAADLRRILDAVVGEAAFHAIYSSADLGRTKRAGGMFELVARAEAVPAAQILHVGDDHEADVVRARGAALAAAHLPRGRRHQAARLVGHVLGVRARMRRSR